MHRQGFKVSLGDRWFVDGGDEVSAEKISHRDVCMLKKGVTMVLRKDARFAGRDMIAIFHEDLKIGVRICGKGE